MLLGGKAEYFLGTSLLWFGTRLLCVEISVLFGDKAAVLGTMLKFLGTTLLC